MNPPQFSPHSLRCITCIQETQQHPGLLVTLEFNMPLAILHLLIRVVVIEPFFKKVGLCAL
jgi:hypothetical protein